MGMVAFIPSSAASAAEFHAAFSSAPLLLRASIAGESASIIVLSPRVAFPIAMIPFRPSCMALANSSTVASFLPARAWPIFMKNVP